MNRLKILVTGAGGQLASAIVRALARDHTLVPASREVLDITNPESVSRAVRDAQPDVIINGAAFNDVDAAEDQPSAAFDVNAFGVQWLARAAAARDAVFVHYGTDFVFNGEAREPYTEDGAPDPRSVYAMSKLLGEWFAAEAPRSYVLRVESLFGGSPVSGRKSSIDRIADAILDGREAVVFADRTVSPSFVHDVAVATGQILERAVPFGLYHCVNSGHCTWLELAEEIARQLAALPTLVARNMADAALRAPRPKYCALSNAKLAGVGIAMPTWQDALARYRRLRGCTLIRMP